MERLTMTSDKGGLAFTFDLDITCEKSEIKKIEKLGERLKEYEDAGLEPEEIKAMKNNGRWIPVSKRLPDNHNNVLICSADGCVNIGYFASKAWRDVNSYPYGYVVAWQPLPEPYRPQE